LVTHCPENQAYWNNKPLLHDDLGTAAGQAEAPPETRVVARKAAHLLPNGASHAATVTAGATAGTRATCTANTATGAAGAPGTGEAVWWNGRFAEANLATLAGVQAVARWRARSTERWVRHGCEGASSFGIGF